jgi:hypothetical protein
MKFQLAPAGLVLIFPFATVANDVTGKDLLPTTFIVVQYTSLVSSLRSTKSRILTKNRLF